MADKPRFLRIRRTANRIFFVSVLIAAYLYVSRFGYDALSIAAPYGWTDAPSGNVQDITFPSRRQNYLIHAFYLPGKADHPALISVPGYRETRHDHYHILRAEALRDLGYSVLSVDLADEGGDTIGNGRIGMGYSERWDVLGGFDYLLAQGFAADQIGVVGESLGGSTSLLAAALEPRLKAVWADSSYARATEAIADRGQASGFPALIIPLIPGGMVWGWLVTGDKLWEASPVDAGATFAAHHQAIYLVHDEKDNTVFYHNGTELNLAYQQAHVAVTFWSVPDLDHAAAFVYLRAEYLQRLDTFFSHELRHRENVILF